ncbi:MAG: hypothetical protein HQ477_06945 [Chloroflexi bacterium]|nr:hypothetical protein [Chloroflexota bacterium]
MKTALLLIAIGIAVASCSTPEPTPVPTATPISTSVPTAWQVYTDSLGLEWDLLGAADDAVNEAWPTFVDSLGPNGDGYPGTAVAVEAALNTFVLRSTAMQEKLKTITPPPECERLHILVAELAKVGVESANAMQEIVSDGYIGEGTTRQLEVSQAQISSVAGDVYNAERECRS